MQNIIINHYTHPNFPDTKEWPCCHELSKMSFEQSPLCAVLCALTPASAATYAPSEFKPCKYQSGFGLLFIASDNATYSTATASEASFQRFAYPMPMSLSSTCINPGTHLKSYRGTAAISHPSIVCGRRFCLSSRPFAGRHVYVNGTQAVRTKARIRPLPST